MSSFRNIFTICSHDLLDQIRDRRTLFMILVLPIVLYPIAGQLVVHLAVKQQIQPRTIAVLGSEKIRPFGAMEEKSLVSVVPMLASMALEGDFFGSVSFLQAWSLVEQLWVPPLFIRDGEKLRLHPKYDNGSAFELLANWMDVKSPEPKSDKDPGEWVAGVIGSQPDAILKFPDDFMENIRGSKSGQIKLDVNEKDDNSLMVAGQIQTILFRYESALRKARFLSRGLPPDFHRLVVITEAQGGKQPKDMLQAEIRNLLKRVIPMLMVMWALVGALYPAVDLCAGEKERGTMETLLISAASRFEIVLGKFLAIWTFSTFTALLNIACMGLTAWYLASSYLSLGGTNSWNLLWALPLLLPLGAFFSSLSLAIGSYAKSSREGQYYLMPLVMVVLPLVLVSMAPGSKINLTYCFVPVAGITLVMQELLAGEFNLQLIGYLVMVMGVTSWYAFMALRWAVVQFQKEEVLFREAELFNWQSLVRKLLPLRSLGESFGFGLAGLLLVIATMFLPGLGYWQSKGIDPVVAGLVPVIFLSMGWGIAPARSLAVTSWSWKYLFLGMGTGVLLMPLLAEIQLRLNLLSGWKELIQNLGQKGKLNLPATMTLGNYYGFVLLPIMARELVFRGFLQGNWCSAFGELSSIGLVAALSAASTFHEGRFLVDLLSGTFAGLLVVRSRSIYPALALQLTLALPALVTIFGIDNLKSIEISMEQLRASHIGWYLILTLSLLGLVLIGIGLICPGFASRVQKTLVKNLRSGVQSGA
ncbi:MAG: hypothetical protein RL595_2362 [Planctomycetota bacterium]